MHPIQCLFYVGLDGAALAPFPGPDGERSSLGGIDLPELWERA